MHDFMRLPVAIVAIALAASACGQRGPLYLRDKPPPPGVKVPKGDTYKPVPYPNSSEDDNTEAGGR